MPAKKKPESIATRGGDVEMRFAELLSIMKGRYLAAGYELDDVHLAEILRVHDGVLRKGKSVSVSPALVKAAGQIWNIDLNWFLLGVGEKPWASGEPLGLERLSRETRIARGRWDEHKVRHFLAERKLMLKDLADLLAIDSQRAGNLVRGTLRDAKLRMRLAEVLKVKPDALFLVSETGAEKRALTRKRLSGTTQPLFNLQSVRRALETMIERHLQRSLAEQEAPDRSAVFKSSEIRLNIPPAPDDLSEMERKRYEHNREVLERWSRTQAAFEVSPSVAERYCREVVGFYEGGQVDDVGGILRDFLQEDLERSDTRPATHEKRLQIKKGVLPIGNTEIEVNDPELLAKLPEYLSSKAGRRRLLNWLRKNVKTK